MKLPTIGYVDGNVHWVHKTVNLMKRDLPMNIFIDFCEKIIKYNKNIKDEIAKDFQKN